MTAMLSTIATVQLDSRDIYTVMIGLDRLLGRRAGSIHRTLGGVLIESDGDQVTFSIFDYATYARYTTPVAGDEFRVLVDARALLKIVRTHTRKPTDRTTFEVNEFGSLTARQGASQATLTDAGIDDMPARPVMPVAYRTVDGAAFDSTFARVAQAAGTDDTLPVLTAVNVHHTAGRIELAATNRFKLAVDQLATDGDESMPDVLWPAGILGKVVRTFGVKHGDVVLHADRDSTNPWVGWSCDGWSVSTRAIDAEFPRYRQLIPSDAQFVFRFDRDTLLTAATCAMKAKALHTGFTADGDSVQVTSVDRDDVALTTRIGVERVQGDDTFSWAFNPGWVVDMLKPLPSSPVSISTTTPNRPFVFTVENAPDYVGLLMPVRLPE